MWINVNSAISGYILVFKKGIFCLCLPFLSLNFHHTSQHALSRSIVMLAAIGSVTQKVKMLMKPSSPGDAILHFYQTTRRDVTECVFFQSSQPVPVAARSAGLVELRVPIPPVAWMSFCITKFVRC